MDGAGRGFPPGDIRVSDADRDAAISELGQALQDGRITADEFEERSQQALRARTGRELTVPLADLPMSVAPAVPAPSGDAGALATRRARVTGLERSALIGAAALSVVSVVNANQPTLNAQQRQLAEQLAAQHGITLTFPPAVGIDWVAVLAPAAAAVLLIVLFIVSRLARRSRLCRPLRTACSRPPTSRSTGSRRHTRAPVRRGRRPPGARPPGPSPASPPRRTAAAQTPRSGSRTARHRTG
jgi:hypothetical protein